MPINWNLAGYVNPDIKITPNEVPLEAILNVGDKLQKDYDFALENDTKLGIAARNMLQNVNEADKAAAMDAFNLYTKNLKDRATKGDYHRMKYQTVADAGELAGIYEGLSARNKEIKEYEQKYILERTNLTDEDKKILLEMSRKDRKPVIFDSENRFVKDLNFDKKLYAGNIETVELLNSLASGWKADAGGGSTEEFSMSDGTKEYKGLGVLPKGTVVKKTVNNKWEKVTGPELETALNSALDSHIGFNQMLARKLEQSLYTTPLQEGETIESRKQQLRSELSKGALDFSVAKNSYTSDISTTNTDINIPKGDDDGSLASGGPDPEGGNAELTSLNIDGKNAEGQELSTVFRNAAKGDISAKILTLSTLKTIEDKLKKEGKTDQAAYVKEQAVNMETILNFVKKYPQFKEHLTNVNYLDPSGFTTFSEAVRVSGVPAEDKRKIAGVRSLHFGKGSIGNPLDTGLENLFENSKSESFRNIPMQTPDLANDKVRNKFESLTQDLTIDDFEIDPEQWSDDTKKVKVISRSTEPAGGGIGHLYRLQDSKGNSFFAEAKKQSGRSLDQQWAKYISNVDMNKYKEVTAPDRPTRFTDILKNAGITYYEPSADENNKKPKFAIDPEEKVIPMDGKFRVIDVDGKIHFYNSIFELINDKEIKYN